MDFAIVTEYPLWFVVFCILAGAVYSYILYRKDRRFNELAKWKIYLLSAFRFLSVFFLAFLLLSPLVRSLSKYIEKPAIIIAQDNSESILLGKDSTFYKSAYIEKMNRLIADLSADYEVQVYSYGSEVRKGADFSFKDKNTDISTLLSEINSRYSNRNVGALVIAGDGIYNKGTNPLYTSVNSVFPVYAIALGDSGSQKDIILREVNYNKMAFLGNKFPIRAYMEANDLKGEKTQLNIYYKGQKIFTQDISIATRNYSESVTHLLEATESGMQRYRIELTTNEAEHNLKNNSKDIIVDVIDSKQKILILANSPHPDVGAIRKALELNLNYQVDFSHIDEFTKPVGDYNLIILHQIPSVTNSATTVLSNIFKFKVPALFVLGGQSSLNNINTLKAGLEIQRSKQTFDEAVPVFNDRFSLFELAGDMKTYIKNVPPLLTPFGDYKNNASSDVLFYQKIKNISTAKPMVLFDNLIDNKVGFITGEGLWKWRMNNYVQNNNHDLFNELINKIVQYLALKINKENFAVNHKKLYYETETVIMEAEVYNESFELVNEQNVSVEIFNSEGKKYPFTFSKTDKAYRLDAGTFAVGDYTYIAYSGDEGKQKTRRGQFSVLPVDIEHENTIADYKLLYMLTQKTNGKLFTPGQLDNLAGELKNNKNIVAISYSDKQLKDIIHLKWIFFILLVLISTEWFLRKYYGSY